MKILNYFLVLLIPTLLNSQNINNPTSKFKIGLEIGHFSPKKESFKENYDQAIYGIPFSAIGIVGHYLYSKNVNLALEIHLIHNSLASTNKVKFDILPIHFGVKYYLVNRISQLLNVKLFIEGKIGYYLNVFSVEGFLFIDNSGHEYGHQDMAQLYQGMGIKTSVGIESPFLQTLDVGIKLDYDYVEIGKIKEGGLGNTGGFIFSLYLLKSL